MVDGIKKILFTETQLDKVVSNLGSQITKDYADMNPLFVGVLKGSFVFMADLIRKVNISCELDFMVVSSYGNSTKTTGAVKINKDLTKDIEGRHIIIVEDILDSGVTLNYLRNYLEGRRPASVKICTLLDKPERRIADVKPDYIGLVCPDEFIVGYGLDYAEKYRNLPYIAVLSPEVYDK